MDKLDQIKKKIEEYQNKSAVTGDLKAFITLVLGVVKTAKENFDKTSKENIQIIQEAVNYIDKEHSKLLKDVSQETESAKNELEKKLNEAKDFLEEVKKIKAKKGEDGEDGYTPVKGVDYFTETEIKEIKDDLSKSIPLELSGEKIVDKINSLPIDEDELKIDASHIKNLPKVIAKSGHSPTVLANAVDLDQTARADGYAVVWDATNGRFKFAASGSGSGHVIQDEGTPLTARTNLNFVGAGVTVTDDAGNNATVVTISGGGGTIDGSGTLNELTYWVDSDTIGSLAVATYPSLTEISYVKGVTSAIQTQLGGKANTALSNLASVAINTSLISDTDSTDDLGSTSIAWRNLYVDKVLSIAGTALNIETPNGTTATGINITTGTASGAGNGGGGILVTAGDGNGAGNGGDINLQAGAGGTTGPGGALSLAAGAGGDGGGSFSISAGNGSAGNANGGDINLTTGSRSGSGAYGKFKFLNIQADAEGILDFSGITVSAKTYTFPNTTGTLALTSDLSSYTPTSRTITVAGTANQITSSAGAQDLSANRTWTLSFPADVIIPTVLTVPNTGLHLLDTNASHDLIIKPGSNLTADKTLTLTTGDADVILDLTAVTDEYVLAYDVGTNTWRGVAATGGGNVSNTGTPTDNQVAVWTNSTTIEGTSNLTFNGSAFALTTIDGEDQFRLAASTGTNATNMRFANTGGTLRIGINANTPGFGIGSSYDTIFLTDMNKPFLFAPNNAVALTLNPGGTATFVGDVTVPDEAYGAGWNGSLEVPTKNAVYDKIETLTAGGVSEALAIAYAVSL